MKRTARLAAYIFATALLAPTLTYGAGDASWYARSISALIPEAPEMVAIARCESGLRQFADGGGVLRGGLGGKMIGLFQLHETYHRSAALAQGYNIDSVLGNIGYARTLYRTQGTTPWRSSAHCWQSTTTDSVAANDTSAAILTKHLRYGSNDPEVARLKDVLIARGFLAATDVGVRTTFDLATLKALIAFQCEEAIACHTGTTPRTGLGRVNDATREKINNYLTTQSLATRR